MKFNENRTRSELHWRKSLLDGIRKGLNIKTSDRMRSERIAVFVQFRRPIVDLEEMLQAELDVETLCSAQCFHFQLMLSFAKRNIYGEDCRASESVANVRIDVGVSAGKIIYVYPPSKQFGATKLLAQSFWIEQKNSYVRCLTNQSFYEKIF